MTASMSSLSAIAILGGIQTTGWQWMGIRSPSTAASCSLHERDEVIGELGQHGMDIVRMIGHLFKEPLCAEEVRRQVERALHIGHLHRQAAFGRAAEEARGREHFGSLAVAREIWPRQGQELGCAAHQRLDPEVPFVP